MEIFLAKIIKWYPLTFQNQISNFSIFVDWFHDYIWILLIFVILLVGGILFITFKNNLYFSPNKENPFIEIIWTIIPAFTLIIIGIPSIFLLYNTETPYLTFLNIKVSGHQWYWSYNIIDLESSEFDSFIKPLNELNIGEFRRLDVDNRLILPLKIISLICVSSVDVLHSWALPSLSIKADANPGRINIIEVIPQIIGIYFGQCSELCGANHRFIPIVVEITRPFLFSIWIKTL